MLSGTGFHTTTNPEDRPLAHSMLRRRMNYKGGNTLAIRKVTAKGSRTWCNVHYAFIEDFNKRYVYCT